MQGMAIYKSLDLWHHTTAYTENRELWYQTCRHSSHWRLSQWHPLVASENCRFSMLLATLARDDIVHWRIYAPLSLNVWAYAIKVDFGMIFFCDYSRIHILLENNQNGTAPYIHLRPNGHHTLPNKYNIKSLRSNKRESSPEKPFALPEVGHRKCHFLTPATSGLSMPVSAMQ